MNYIWDVLLKADKQNIPAEKISFVPAKRYSPYMEISFKDLNTQSLLDNHIIEVNPYYRFYDIFKELLNVNIEESMKLREVLFDIIIHYLAEIDLKQGLCKQEFYKKFIMKDICKGVFGKELSENIYEFKKEELDCLLNGLVTLYLTGVSLHLFNKVMRNIFKDNLTYTNKENSKEILIYLGQAKTQNLKRKMDMIIDLFLPIDMKVYVYWEHHFGVIGVNETMKIDKMVIN
ncbi:hypothetical protein [Clostridium sp. ZS2-4]|uniref:hypothetical protein n=1 Tax=Clostridium sp. ZS2-4 TaxID=2987703 RepID=UPI00227C4C34|nr:hypothetical protein [Clostridium sp. ZS2-4]MCY6355723.1 hypothetical protein [Clostridium sp. ZS2-4]